MPTYAFRGNEALIQAIESRLADAGYERQDDVAGADYVLTFCTSMTALEDLYFDEGALVETLDAGTFVIDMSACTPNLATEIASVCVVSGISMVCAPMIVKNKVEKEALVQGNLACFAGSEGDEVDRALPFLEVIFGDVRMVADAGSAQLARAASTIQNTAEMVSAIETLSLFKACAASSSTGLNVQALVPETTSSEAAFILKAIREEQFESDYTVEMLMSELSAAIMTGDDYETILPQTEAAFHLYELLAMIGGADMSPAALALVYEGEPSDLDDGDADDADDDGHGHSHRVDFHGLDWGRVEHLYGHDMADEVVDEFGTDTFPMDDASGDGDPYDDDDFASGFGYSIN